MAGTVFGKFELLKRIGIGGMGEIFLARQQWMSGTEKLCVVKKILPSLYEQEGFVPRFKDEGRVVVHLSHGNIAQVFEMGEIAGEYFMAMEYVDGKTLEAVIRGLEKRSRLCPLEVALWIGIKVCEGLAYAHRKTDPVGNALKIIHRDVSPANVMVTYDGEVKIIDFGAALSALKEVHTAPGVAIGNLDFMSPEQVLKIPIDTRTDIFSLGIVLWTLLGGVDYDRNAELAKRIQKVAYPTYVPLRSFRSDLPPEVDVLLSKATQPKAADRFADADTMRVELQKLLFKVAPNTDQRTLAQLMNDLFAGAKKEQQRFLAEAMGQASATGANAKVDRGPTEPFLQSPFPQPSLAKAPVGLKAPEGIAPLPVDATEKVSERHLAPRPNRPLAQATGESAITDPDSKPGFKSRPPSLGEVKASRRPATPARPPSPGAGSRPAHQAPRDPDLMPTEPAREMNAEMRALLKKSKPNAPQEPDTLKSGSTDPTDLVRSNHQIPRLVMGLAIGAVILGVIVLLAKGLG